MPALRRCTNCHTDLGYKDATNVDELGECEERLNLRPRRTWIAEAGPVFRR